MNIQSLSAVSANLGHVRSGRIEGTTIHGNTISGGSISGTTISGTTITGGHISGTTISGGVISGSRIEGITVEAQNIIGDVVKSYVSTFNGRQAHDIVIPAFGRQRLAYLMPVMLSSHYFSETRGGDRNEWEYVDSASASVTIKMNNQVVIQNSASTNYGRLYVSLQGSFIIPAHQAAHLRFEIRNNGGLAKDTKFVFFVTNA